MADQQSAAQKAYGDIPPGLADLSDRVLFGEVWERPGLSKRDRSLVTVAALVAGYRQNELPGHVRRALANGGTRTELVELVTHLASMQTLSGITVQGDRYPAHLMARVGR